MVNTILEQDQTQPKKPRHTAQQIFDRLRKKHGYRGAYTIAKDYVRLHKLHHREMFVPLVHAPGEAQADFGQAQVIVAGVEQCATSAEVGQFETAR